ncbi:MAG: hypothetical protein ACI38Z_08425 [Parafannyhessea sp.]|uniref:hypothetical protein n=1 Tax=Parafannyhessea sp. TaxID=2847324 RepID=UPI003F1185E3
MRTRRTWLRVLCALLVATCCFFAYGMAHPLQTGPTSSADGTNADSLYSSEDFRTVLRNYGLGVSSYANVSKIVRESYVIPGLKVTRTLDADDNLCSCTTMTPQGVCVAGRYLLVSAYCRAHAHNSVIYRINRKTHQLDGVIVLNGKPHVGGLAYDARHHRLWICGYQEGKHGCATVSSIELKAWEKYDASRAKAPCRIERTYLVRTLNHASFLTVYSGKLYVGDFTGARKSRTTIQAFDIESDGGLREADKDEVLGELERYRNEGQLAAEQGWDADELGMINVRKSRVLKNLIKRVGKTSGDILDPVDGALINGQAQGMGIVGDLCLLSQSWGSRDSYLRVMWWGGGAWSHDLRNDQSWATFVLPPMLEEMDLYGGKLYLCFESAAAGYRWEPIAKVDRIVVCDVHDVLGS